MDQFKRTSVSIPSALHKRVRIRCAYAGTKISDEVVAAINAYFAGEDEELARKPVEEEAS